MRIGVLNNLRAGRSDAQVTRVLKRLRGRTDVVHIETDSARILPEALAELERHEVELLVLNGGDGTLQFALTELLAGDTGRIPWIAPLRGGRTNMTATDLGARRDPGEALSHLLAAADDGSLERLRVDRPVLRVRSSRRGGDQYGMFFGAGLIYRAIRIVHRLFPPGRSQGLFGASLVTAALVAKLLFRPTDGVLTPDKAGVQIDGREVSDAEFYLLIATSLDRLFLRMNPFWGVGPGGVRLSALASRAERLARAAPGILRGRPLPWLAPETGYTSARADVVKIRMGCGFTIDGELFDPEPDEVVELAADRRVTFLRA